MKNYNFPKYSIWTLNILLFVCYYLIFSFMAGFLVGIFEGASGIDGGDGLLGVAVLIAFVFTAIYTLTKKSSFYITHK